MERFECDCHCHTTRSDGKDTPEELIENALKFEMRGLAIVDHDILPPTTLNLSSSLPLSFKLVLGYEFSCDKYVDDVHLIGYNLDWNHPGIIEEVAAAAKSKGDAYEELCEVLTRHGMPIDFQREILKFKNVDGSIVTRTKDEVQRKHVFECMAAKGYAKSWNDAKLLVRDNPDFNIRRRKIDPLDAIKLIHDAGGLAVLAHPFLIDERVMLDGKKEISREKYVERFFDLKLDVIESFYTYEKTSYQGKMNRYQIRDYLERTYKDKVRFFTAGSDYHNDNKGKENMNGGRYIGECGISLREFEKIFF